MYVQGTFEMPKSRFLSEKKENTNVIFFYFDTIFDLNINFQYKKSPLSSENVRFNLAGTWA